MYQAEDRSSFKSEKMLADLNEKIKLFQTNEDICSAHQAEISALLNSSVL